MASIRFCKVQESKSAFHLLLTYQSTLLTFNFEEQIQKFLHLSKVEKLYDDLVVYLRVPQIFEERLMRIAAAVLDQARPCYVAQ